jgi:hypothetical protein
MDYQTIRRTKFELVVNLKTAQALVSTIVFASVSDLIGEGFVANLPRPTPEQKCITGLGATEEVVSGTDGGFAPGSQLG